MGDANMSNCFSEINASLETQTVNWKTTTEENFAAFFRRTIGGLYVWGFLMASLSNFGLFRWVHGTLGETIVLVILISGAILIGIRYSRSRTYTIDYERKMFYGPGLKNPISLTDIQRYSVPQEDTFDVNGAGLQIIWVLFVRFFLMAPIFPGEFQVYLKNGKKKTIDFARHETALHIFYWFQSHLNQI